MCVCMCVHEYVCVYIHVYQGCRKVVKSGGGATFLISCSLQKIFSIFVL